MKVHFAGNGIDADELLAAGVRYRLESFYEIKVRGRRDTLEQWNSFRHVIIDSGLFTLMFGSEAGMEITMEFCERWLSQYVEFINATPFRCADFVELDVQKKLSVEAAWELRRRMRGLINKGTIINVYHLEDENPDRLIDYSDYIAVSIPELRFNPNVSERERYAITRYISHKAKARGKRVHLLGCTERKYMRAFSYCDSSDSTSWQAAFRYGKLKSSTFGTIVTSHLRQKYDPEIGRRAQDTYYSAVAALHDYEKFAGDQS